MTVRRTGERAHAKVEESIVSIQTKSDGPCGAKGLLITSSMCYQHEELCILEMHRRNTQ